MWGKANQQPPSPAKRSVCGTTPCWPLTQRRRCTKHACWAPFYTLVRLGPYTRTKSEDWTRNLRRLLGITWQNRVSNADGLAREGMSSMFATLSHRRLIWLGHLCRMEDGRIPKDILYGELASGTRSLVDPPCATRMSATEICSHSTSTQQTLKQHLSTALAGVKMSNTASRRREI
jgi:hypothetical protein